MLRSVPAASIFSSNAWSDSPRSSPRTKYRDGLGPILVDPFEGDRERSDGFVAAMREAHDGDRIGRPRARKKQPGDGLHDDRAGRADPGVVEQQDDGAAIRTAGDAGGGDFRETGHRDSAAVFLDLEVLPMQSANRPVVVVHDYRVEFDECGVVDEEKASARRRWWPPQGTMPTTPTTAGRVVAATTTSSEDHRLIRALRPTPILRRQARPCPAGAGRAQCPRYAACCRRSGSCAAGPPA